MFLYRTKVGSNKFQKWNVGLDCTWTETKTLEKVWYDNHLGSACLELDSTASIVSYEEYHPFGTTSYRSGRSETEVSLKRYKFHGKEKDEETGLHYHVNRYYAPWIARWISVDALSDKYPSTSPFTYCLNNPVVLVDPDGREIWTTSEGWAIMERAFNATLGKKNNPFTFNYESGKVEFDNNMKIGKLDDKQQEIVDKYKSLTEDKNFKVNVHVVDNDKKLDLGDGDSKSLKDKGWNGAAVLSDDKKQTDVYVSTEPFYKDGNTGKYTINPQKENMQGIISIHEIGGHAYGNQQKIYNEQNNIQTKTFEGRVRSIYKSMYQPNYIKNQPVISH